MAESAERVIAEAEEDLRYSSRKWRLVNSTVRLYTLVHLLNAATLILSLDREWLGESFVKDLWTTSLMIWSAGVLAIVGWYFKVNVDQKAVVGGGG